MTPMAHDNGAPPGLLMDGREFNCLGLHRVTEVTFESSAPPVAPDDTIDTWDVSAARDGSVVAWMRNDRHLHVTTCGHGPVTMPGECDFMFRFFERLKRADLRGANMADVRSARSMFYGCTSLEEALLPVSMPRGIDTANMFVYCDRLAERPEQVRQPIAYHGTRL